jgi:hypothetical protein
MEVLAIQMPSAFALNLEQRIENLPNSNDEG